MKYLIKVKKKIFILKNMMKLIKIYRETKKRIEIGNEDKKGSVSGQGMG